jgi:hypothetical protein
MKDRRKDRNELEARKKTKAVTGRSKGNKRLLDIKRGSTGLHSVENPPRKRQWNCKTDCRMNE